MITIAGYSKPNTNKYFNQAFKNIEKSHEKKYFFYYTTSFSTHLLFSLYKPSSEPKSKIHKPQTNT